MLTPNDLILFPRQRVTVQQLLRAIGPDKLTTEIVEYTYELVWICRAVGVDAAIAFVQAHHETGGFTSDWWLYRRNPAGMGITGDPKQESGSPKFATGAEAARAQVAHLLLYATGTIDRGSLEPEDNPRFDAYVSKYGLGVAAAQKLGQLGKGKWAADPEYDTKICTRGKEILPSLPRQGGSVDIVLHERMEELSFALMHAYDSLAELGDLPARADLTEFIVSQALDHPSAVG